MLKVQFAKAKPGMAGGKLLANAELVFDGREFGPMEDCRLGGISIWRGKDGKPYASFPSREYTKNGKKQYWEHLRSPEGQRKWELKNFIVDQFNGWWSEQDHDEPSGDPFSSGEFTEGPGDGGGDIPF